MNAKKIEAKSLSFGDVIEIKINNQLFNGEFIREEENLIIIKLKSGYDIALPRETVDSISVIEKARNEEKEEEKENKT